MQLNGGPDGWWPTDADGLERLQAELVRARPSEWQPGEDPQVGASACCTARPAPGLPDPPSLTWAAAYRPSPNGDEIAVSRGRAPRPYVPGQLALREGPLRTVALRRLMQRPDVVLVTAAGRDHPAGAGLATLLGAALDLPTIGITDRPLVARGGLPPETAGGRSPLTVGGELVGWWLRTRTRLRPVAVSAGWRTSPQVA